MVSGTIFIDPIGKGRPRVTRSGHAFTPDKTRKWEEACALLLKTSDSSCELPIKSPVKITAHFHFRRPKSHYDAGKNSGKLRDDAPQYHSSKPDVDNVQKAFFDAIVKAGLIEDDSQICSVEITKIWSSVGCITYDIYPRK